MIKLSALYKRIEGCEFDERYYLENHIPMAKEILENFGLVKMEVDIFEDLEGITNAKYYAMTHAFFEDGTSLEAVQKQEAVAKIFMDVENYTNVIPVLQKSRVI